MSAATQARALVDALLNGNLAKVTRTAQAHTLRIPSMYLPFRAAPATTVTTVTINGVDVDSGIYSFTPFLLVREDGELWPTGRILITYDTGWTAGNEPGAVQEALAAIEARLTTQPDDSIASLSVGGVSTTFVSAHDTGVTTNERALLNKWIQP